MNDDAELERRVRRRAEWMARRQQETPTVLAQTVYLGTLGIVLVLPTVVGAYIGHWLDLDSPGFSIRWTLGLLFAGLAVGAYSAYRMISRN